MNKTLFWILCGYVSYCGVMYVIQRQLIFPRYLPEIPLNGCKPIPGLEKIWLDIRGGQVESWFISAGHAQKPAPAVIFAHGNAELIDFWVDELMPFVRKGISLMLVEYPGYGRSTGIPSQDSVTETFVAAYDKLVARSDVNASQIILMGRSLGGGAVCQLAEKRPSIAMILMSTFTSIRSFALRYMLPACMVRDPFDNLSVVASYPNPILIVHGTKDQTVPYSHGKTLFQTAKNGLLITYEAGHNDCPPQWEMFWQEVDAFLTNELKEEHHVR